MSDFSPHYKGRTLVLFGGEVASAAETGADEAEKEAAAAKLRVEKLAQRLQELGMGVVKTRRSFMGPPSRRIPPNPP